MASEAGPMARQECDGERRKRSQTPAGAEKPSAKTRGHSLTVMLEGTFHQQEQKLPKLGLFSSPSSGRAVVLVQSEGVGSFNIYNTGVLHVAAVKAAVFTGSG